MFRWVSFVFIVLLGCSITAEARTDRPTREEIYQESQQLVDAHDFVTLDKKLHAYESKLIRIDTGFCALDVAFFAASERINSTPMAAQIMQEWQSAVPDSSYPKLAYINYTYQMLWKLRGSGYASTVAKNTWASLQQGADDALGKLELISFPKGKSPIYYKMRILLETLTDREDKKAAMLKIFEDGVKQYPTYYSLYIEMARLLEPKWFGRPGEVTAFAAQQAERVGGDEGAIVYNRIVRQLLFSVNYGSNVAARSRNAGYFYEYPDVNWTLMRQGFEKLTEKYPADWTLNDFAWFSCLANDRQTASRVIERIGDHLLPEVWGGDAVMQAWLDWATFMPTLPVPEAKKKGWTKHPVPGYQGYILGSDKDGQLTGLAEFDNSKGEHIEYVTINGEPYGLGYLRSGSREIRGRPMSWSNSAGPGFGMDGWIRESVPEGNRIYMGELSNSLPDGMGLDQVEGRYSYLGHYMRGMRNGLGKLIRVVDGNAELYIGEFKDDRPEGFGVLLGAKEFSGLSYVGEFKNGQAEGIGAVITVPVWAGQMIRDEDVQFVRVDPDGNVSAIGPQEHAGFGLLHFRIDRVAHDYIGHIEGNSSKGMGVLLTAGNSPHLDVGLWENNAKNNLQADLYHTNGHDEHMYDSRRVNVFIPRGGWVEHGRHRNGVWYQGTLIFTDGRILRLNDGYRENLKKLFASTE